MNQTNNSPILQIKDLVVRFHTPEGIINAVNGVNIDLMEGETLGLVGESGCGKSVTMLSTLRLIPNPPGKIEKGEVWFNGQNLLTIPDIEIRDVRGRQISMVFQDPIASLNPVHRIGDQVAEPLLRHMKMDSQQAQSKAIELLSMVGIANAQERSKSFPHQFSGGMRQRVMIAMALSCHPKILIADEPTTALDVTIQAQIVELIKRLREEFGMSIIWITHDLGVVATLAHRVVVMYAGLVIEDVVVRELYNNPAHPYTIGLLSSLPGLERRSIKKKLATIPGSPPTLWKNPVMCPFQPRCQFSVPNCQVNPPLFEISPGHRVACWVNLKNGSVRV